MKGKNKLISFLLIASLTSSQIAGSLTVAFANESISDESAETFDSPQSQESNSITIPDHENEIENSSDSSVKKPKSDPVSLQKNLSDENSQAELELETEPALSSDNAEEGDQENNPASIQEIILDDKDHESIPSSSIDSNDLSENKDTETGSSNFSDLKNQNKNEDSVKRNEALQSDQKDNKDENELILSDNLNQANNSQSEVKQSKKSGLSTGSQESDEAEKQNSDKNSDLNLDQENNPEESDSSLISDSNRIYVPTDTPIEKESRFFSNNSFYSSISLNPLKNIPMGYDNYQVINKKQNGIYFITSEVVSFYSFKDGTTSEVLKLQKYTEYYSTGSKVYFFNYKYDASTINVSVLNMDSKKIERTFKISFSKAEPESYGVDDQGRIYIGTVEYSGGNPTYKIQLFSSAGTFLSSIEVDTPIVRFSGFDQSTGTFYYECLYNWYSWGADHNMRATGYGRVLNGKLTSADCLFYDESLVEKNTVFLLGQHFYNTKPRMFEDIGGGYLISDSTYNSRVMIWKKNGLNHSKPDVPILSNIYRDNKLSDSFVNEPAGVRAAYMDSHKTVLIARSITTVYEIDTVSNTVVCSFEAKYPICTILTMDETVYLIEKNRSKYYLEKISNKKETALTIKASKTTIEQGESLQLTVSGNGDYSYDHYWTSSDPTVLNISSLGIITGCRPGTAVVTVRNLYGYKTSISITVKAKSLKSGNSAVLQEAEVTYNMSSNDYSLWSQPVKSNLYQNSDGSFTRVEHVNSSSPYLLVENYTSSFVKTGTRKLKDNLGIYGGFYHGKNKNYVVSGQSNPSESNSLICIRLIQYSHDWIKEKTLDISNINTVIPFDGGSCRMTETDNYLYIYTCHKMCKTEDDLNHQENMFFEIQKSDLSISQSFVGIDRNINISLVGHSFNQFIQTDGDFLFKVDHADASPRAISLIKSSLSNSIYINKQKSTYIIANFDNYHYNYTGVSVGGMELSDDNVLIAANSVNMEKRDSQRNILVTVTDKSLTETKIIWLTNYASDADIEVRTPQLVKLNNSHFMVLWEEAVSSDEYYNPEVVTKAVFIDGSGNQISSVYTYNIYLSDCQPIYCSDGLIRWYVSDFSTCILYSLQPYDQDKNEKLLEDTLSAPVLYSANLTLDGSVLSWSKVYRATGYNVYKSTSENGTYSFLKSVTGGNLTYTDSSVTSGKTYYYKVRPYKKSNGETVSGSYSNVKSLKFENSPSLSASPKSGVTMSLSWNKASNSGGYEIWYSTNGSSYSLVKTVGASQTSTSHTILSAGKLYYYKLATLDQNGTRISVSSAQKAAALAPATISSASQNIDGITLKWSKASGADSYNIYRSTSSGGTYSYVSSVVGANTLSWTDRNVEAGKTYYYKVRPYKRISGTVYYASWTSPTKLTMKSSVKSVKAVPKSGVTMTLSWASVSGAKSYDIYYSTNGKSYTKVKKVGSTQKSTSHTGLKAGTLYYYKIAALDSNNKAIAICDGKKAVALAPASISSITRTKDGVKIDWSRASGSDRYNIYRSTSKNGTYEYLQSNVGVDNRTFTDKTVKKGQTYHYKIRPYKRVDGVVYYANWADAKTIKVQ